MKGKIFDTQEVSAIQRRNKIRFREAIKPQPNSNMNPVNLEVCNTWQWATKESRRECPYQIGQKLFVKESFTLLKENNLTAAVSNKYVSLFRSELIESLELEINYKWKPAQHLKQEHARLFLQVTDIRVERLKDLSEGDVKKEGFNLADPFSNVFEEFKQRWNLKNKQPYSWDTNPWVWVIDFKLLGG